MRAISCCLLLLLSITLAAPAALPPLSPEARTAQATDILDGTVLNVRSRSVEVAGGSDTEYTLNFRVENKVKGSLHAGILVPVQMRQTARRPEGWAGPQGQNEIPAEGQKVRLYLLESEGVYRALEPNGWEAR